MKLKLIALIPILFIWLWSTGFVAAKYALPFTEPFVFLLLRSIIVVALLFAIIFLARMERLSRHQIAGQMIVGMLIHGAYLGGVFFAIKQGVPAGISSIIVGLQPILSAAIGWLWLRESLRLSGIFGLVLGFLGVALVIAAQNNLENLSLPWIGLMACFAALISQSLGNTLQKKLSRDLPLVSGSLYQFIGAALLLGALTFTTESQSIEFTFELIAGLTWLVLALSILATLLLMYMIREGEVAKVASYFYLVPPVTVIQTWILFDEALAPLAIFGCALTAFGVYLIIRK